MCDKKPQHMNAYLGLLYTEHVVDRVSANWIRSPTVRSQKQDLLSTDSNVMTATPLSG